MLTIQVINYTLHLKPTTSVLFTYMRSKQYPHTRVKEKIGEQHSIIVIIAMDSVVTLL
jgi:hypothetical protein